MTPAEKALIDRVLNSFKAEHLFRDEIAAVLAERTTPALIAEARAAWFAVGHAQDAYSKARAKLPSVLRDTLEDKWACETEPATLTVTHIDPDKGVVTLSADEPPVDEAPAQRVIPTCIQCGTPNEYQSGPYVCYACQAPKL